MRMIHKIAYPFLALLLHNSRRVRVIVTANNHILLQRSSLGSQKWSLPGGGVEKSESLKAAAVRETYEEAGIKISPPQLKYLGETASQKRWPSVTMNFFKVELKDQIIPKISRPLEILEVRWFKLGELPSDRSLTVDVGLDLSVLSARQAGQRIQ